MANLYWISWHQPTSDHRPLGFPPNPNILGWWKTGVRLPDRSSVLCATVKANTAEDARAFIKVDWPEADEWRFTDVLHTTVLSDRFKIEPWMHERMSKFTF